MDENTTVSDTVSAEVVGGEAPVEEATETAETVVEEAATEAA